jgi:hypothetical protein
VPGFGRDLANLQDIDNDGDVDVGAADLFTQWIAASLHEWSLQKGSGGNCGYAVTVKYPTWDEQQNQQRFHRHFRPIATCSLEAPATSFPNQTSTIVTL